MNNKRWLILFCPAFVFLSIAVGAFALSEQEIQRHNVAQERENQAKFDKFVANVRSGKWELTPDKWIEGMRLERDLTESERQFSLGSARTMRAGGWYLLVGVVFQAVVVISVKGAFKKP